MVRTSLARMLSALLVVVLVLSLAPSYAAAPKTMAPEFRQWLNEDVIYIINQDERREFLALNSDDEREKFIKIFWDTRNPNPGSPLNTFKEEHYRRLAYVKEHFGDSRYNDGWRTDMGRVYITLGAPQQIDREHMGISTRPVEVWFYQSPTLALPAYFNLVFYKPSDNEDYKLYSPREDGPTKIVTNDMHNPASALKAIRQSMGSEVEHAMLTLLPDEPVDYLHPDPSMTSDLLLDMVRNLPEQKLEKERLARQRAALKESVTVNFFTAGNAAELESAVLRDSKGLLTLNLMVRKAAPDPGLIGPLPDQRTGYDMTLETRVLTAGGKAVYQRTDRLSAAVSAAAADLGRKKIFAAEARLPVVPGQYTVESVLTNHLNRQSTRTSAQVSVPPVHSDSLGLSELIVYRDTPIHMQSSELPFTLSNVRFAPRGEQAVNLRLGEKLPLVYQMWIPAQLSKPGDAAANIHVHYVIGAIAQSASSGHRVEEDDDIVSANADAAGNLLTGHTLDTTTLPTGTYRLVVKATAPGVAPVFTSMAVHILPESEPVAMWSAYGDPAQHPAWQDDMLRGLAAEAQGDPTEAAACYRRSLAANPKAQDVQLRLDALSRKLAQSKPPQ